MAVANLNEIVQFSIMRKNRLTSEIMLLSEQKRLATYSTSDENSLLNCAKADLRANFEEMFDNDPSLQELYTDYTDIPDYQEQMEILQAKYDERLEELSNWELDLDTQIKTDSTELDEVNAYLESYKQMLSSNIQEDFNFGLKN